MRVGLLIEGLYFTQSRLSHIKKDAPPTCPMEVHAGPCPIVGGIWLLWRIEHGVVRVGQACNEVSEAGYTQWVMSDPAKPGHQQRICGDW